MSVTEKRTQVYLPAELHEQVQRYAKGRGLSIAAVIRISLQRALAGAPHLPKQAYQHDSVWRVIGSGRSKDGDLSIHHDHYLYGKPRSKSA